MPVAQQSHQNHACQYCIDHQTLTFGSSEKADVLLVDHTFADSQVISFCYELS